MNDNIYILEECLAPGIWMLLSDTFYTSKDEANEDLSIIRRALNKHKKGFIGRVTELHVHITEFDIINKK